MSSCHQLYLYTYASNIKDSLNGCRDRSFKQLSILHYFEDMVHHVEAIDFSLSFS